MRGRKAASVRPYEHVPPLALNQKTCMPKPKTPRSIGMLFIGNSFTQRHDLPLLVAQMATHDRQPHRIRPLHRSLVSNVAIQVKAANGRSENAFHLISIHHVHAPLLFWRERLVPRPMALPPKRS